MTTEPFIGRWKVGSCFPDLTEQEKLDYCMRVAEKLKLDTNDPDDDVQVLQGCEFELTKSGDVFWYPVNPTSSANFPLFNCETFEVLREREGLSVVVSLRFAAYLGHVIEFQLSQVEVNRDRAFAPPTDGMSLAYPGLFVLHCHKIRSSGTQLHQQQQQTSAAHQGTQVYCRPFHLLAAMEEEFFADTEIFSATGKRFHVHRLVLESALPSMDWSTAPCPLAGLSDQSLSNLLHFAYGQCLPENISAEAVDQCAEVVKDLPGFEGLVTQGKAFQEKSALCKKITFLVKELHAAGESIIAEIVGNIGNSSDRSQRQQYPEQQLVRNPGRMSHVLRQSLRFLAVGFAKLLQLGHLFVIHREGLDREEQHEIIDYAKACLPVFLGQLHRFLAAFKRSTEGMKLHTRHELAAHFVPELEALTELFNRIGCEVKELLEAVMAADSEALSQVSSSAVGSNRDQPSCSSSSSSPRPSSSSADTTGHQQETGFHYFYDSYDAFSHKNYGSTKFKSLKHTLAIKDLFSLKMTHRHFVMILSYLVQERDTFVKQGSAGKVRLVSWQIDQIVDELPLFILRLEEFSNMLDERLLFGTFKFCFVVGATLVDNLLNKFRRQKLLLQPFLELLCSLVQNESFNASLTDMGLLDQPSLEQQQQQPAGACGGLDEEDSVNRSSLPGCCRDLSFDRRMFLSPPSLEDNVLAQNVLRLLESKEGADMTLVVHEEDSAAVEVRCHRVVLAARCPYFRRALMSGMKEAIERRIDVYDTNLTVFTLFLRFVYSGSLEGDGEDDHQQHLGIETLSELLLLADRYEMDSLKEVCESCLQGLVEMESAVTLLSIADQFNAAKLKAFCVNFILENEDVVESDAFRDDLDENLQREILDLVNWGRTATQKSMEGTPDGFSRLISLAAGLRLRENQYDELESIPLTHDSSQLESCVIHLRDVLGPLIDQDQLVRVALAADYDVNRALNYFFNEEQTGAAAGSGLGVASRRADRKE